jgi:hypothetical protein
VFEHLKSWWKSRGLTTSRRSAFGVEPADELIKRTGGSSWNRGTAPSASFASETWATLMDIQTYVQCARVFHG